MKIVLSSDRPTHLKNVEPGCFFHVAAGNEKSFGWKGIEEATSFPFAAFTSRFMNTDPFELVDASVIGDLVVVPHSDAELVAENFLTSQSDTPFGTFLVSAAVAGVVVKKGRGQRLLLDLTDGKFKPVKSTEAWMNCLAWKIIKPVDPKADEKRRVIFTFEDKK